ncbi:MAG: hypothetical protein FJ290_09970 [Planctomycetes bacterium]|nr:hypothetical protein [Planctomycetota bacterium]
MARHERRVRLAFLIVAEAASLAWSGAADEGPTLRAWALPPGAQKAEGREGWKALSAEAARAASLAGGVAVETPDLVAVLAAGSAGVSLAPKAAGKAGAARLELVLVDDQGREATGLKDLRCAECDGTGVTIAFAAGAAEARLKIGLGKPFVELVPGTGVDAVRMRGRARLAFIPDFFGSDVLYDATETRVDKVYAPAENFFVQLLDGHAALAMLVWPKEGADEVVLTPEGEGPARRFAVTQVGLKGKSLYVALLAREGIWFGKDLASAAKDETFVVEGWRPPFAAKWMTILAKRPALGAASGVASETMEAKALPPKGDTPYSDVYVHPWVPSWLSGTEWRLHLQTELTHMMTREKVRSPDFLLAVNYPRDRVKGTPLDAFTLVDVMRGALGAGPCEYILDLEGLNKTRSTGAAGTGKPTAAATCSERGGLMYYYLSERAETPRREDPLAATDQALESVEKIKDFLDAAHARIQEYLAWSDKIIELADSAAAKEPAAKGLADRVIPIARGMRQLWNTMAEHGKPCAFPEEWRLALDHCKDLIRQAAPNLAARVRDFDPQMRGAGEEVDGGMQALRMAVKRIRQEAALAGAGDPKALGLAAAVRERCRDVLRNKHYKEGDSVRLSGIGEGTR